MITMGTRELRTEITFYQKRKPISHSSLFQFGIINYWEELLFSTNLFLVSRMVACSAGRDEALLHTVVDCSYPAKLLLRGWYFATLIHLTSTCLILLSPHVRAMVCTVWCLNVYSVALPPFRLCRLYFYQPAGPDLHRSKLNDASYNRNANLNFDGQCVCESSSSTMKPFTIHVIRQVECIQQWTASQAEVSL